MINVRRFAAALAAAALLFTGVSAANAQAPGTKPAKSDPMAAAKASLKARYGFTDTQSTTAIKKAETVLASYRPKIAGLQKKYGANPTPEQRQKAQKEAMPMLMEMSAKLNAAMLSVATPAQRPKIEAEFKAQQAQMKQMGSGKPKG